MSKQSANQFLEAAAQDTDLREKFQAADEPQQFIEVASELGYNFTTDELKDVVTEHSKGVKLRRKTGIWPWLRTVRWM